MSAAANLEFGGKLVPLSAVPALFPGHELQGDHPVRFPCADGLVPWKWRHTGRWFPCPPGLSSLTDYFPLGPVWLLGNHLRRRGAGSDLADLLLPAGGHPLALAGVFALRAARADQLEYPGFMPGFRFSTGQSYGLGTGGCTRAPSARCCPPGRQVRGAVVGRPPDGEAEDPLWIRWS